VLIKRCKNNYLSCDNCEKIHDGMYMIRSVELILCKTCLFKLALEINDMFEINSLLDGTDYNVVKAIYNNMGIPRDVYEAICEGQIITAIKAYREHIGYYKDPDGNLICKITLIEARDKVKYWQKIIKNNDPY